MRRFIFTAPFLALLIGLSVWSVSAGVDMLGDAYGEPQAAGNQVLGGERSLEGGDRSAAVVAFFVLALGIVLAGAATLLAWWSFRDAPERRVKEPELA